MRKHKILRTAAAGTLAFSALFGAAGDLLPGQWVLPVSAQSEMEAAEERASFGTPAGVANFNAGSASITIRPNGSQSLIRKEFRVYRLFDAQNSANGESINYTWNAPYKAALQSVVGRKLNKPAASVTEYMVIDYINSLNTAPVEGAQASQELEGSYSNFRYFIEELRTELTSTGVEGDRVVVSQVRSDGSVLLSNMAYGYYVVDEITSVSGTHAAASLIMVDTANPGSVMEIKSDYPTLTKKIQEDDGTYGWNDIADYEIGQTVPYRFQSAVPDMNGYETYSFIFHDKMDDCLTFDRTSVKVTISSDAKTYTLPASEYSVASMYPDETFQILIDDLRAIVDREFPEGINDKGENVYGQAIEVTFSATLNEKAALKTGRPGFENSARLEFSNDPDTSNSKSTGFTPWDTVVAFTYKIEGLKVNDKDAKLEGAKFRLYSDADLTQEVYVKKSDAGYIVINRDSTGGTDHTGGTVPADAVEMVSDAKGVFNILGLDQGTYWLKETQAPDGYRKLLDAIQITVSPSYTLFRQEYVQGTSAGTTVLKGLDVTAAYSDFYDGVSTDQSTALTTDVQAGSAALSVVNQVGTKLPVTGSSATWILLGAGTVVTLLGAGASLRRKQKEQA